MSKLRGALVGFGFIAERGHAPAYATRDDLEIVAVVDINAERRARAAAAFPNARIFTSYEALLSEAGRTLDFVDICTPPYCHAEIALAAMESGLHVLCEKPLATSLKLARAMVDKAKASGRVLFPAHNYRHAPIVKAVRNVLAEGMIGDIHLVTLETFRPTHARGVTEWNEHWRREPRYSGGGIAMDHGPHTYYLAFEWMRSYPSAIAAHSSSRGNAATEDMITARLRFPTGLALATLTWTAGMRKVLYTLHGERGAIRIEDDTLEVSVRNERDGKVGWDVIERRAPSHWVDAGHPQWFASLFDEFRDTIARGEFVSSSARDALACIASIDAGYRSATAGGTEVELGRTG